MKPFLLQSVTTPRPFAVRPVATTTNAATLRSLLFVLATLATLSSCAGSRPTTLGAEEGKLAPCPPSPNCVFSQDQDPSHFVLPLRLAVPSAQGWAAARATVAATARVHIVTESNDYLHAECQSSLLGFVDDLELQLRAEDAVIEIRSASRLGYSDMGVNGRRVEDLRSELQKLGVVLR